jgi:hypothetical protein
MANTPLKLDNRCEPIRQNIARLQEEIRSIEEDLTPPLELPPDVIKRLKVILKRDQSLMRQLRLALVKCEAIPAMPTRG